jgi:hypothetical protein
MWHLGMIEVDELFGSFATCLLDQAGSFLYWPALQVFVMDGRGWALDPRSVIDAPTRETRTGNMLAYGPTRQLHVRRISLDLQSVIVPEANTGMRTIFLSLQQHSNLEYLITRLKAMEVDGNEILLYDCIAPLIIFGDLAAPATYVCLKELSLMGAASRH